MEVVSVICNISESWGASLTASNRCVVKVQVDAVQLARWTDGVGPAGLARTRRTFVVSLAAAGPLLLAALRGVARASGGRSADLCLSGLLLDVGGFGLLAAGFFSGGDFSGGDAFASALATLAERMFSKMSGRFQWLHMIRYCWMKVIVLFAIQ